MPFGFYRRLSPRQKAIYRQSDALGELRLPDGAAAAERARRLETALASGEPRAVATEARALVAEILEQLGLPPVRVRVLSVRPSSASSELHGLYESEEGKIPTITVWMRTAAKGRIVAFKTFLRTLLHEACHHLDFAYLDLAESYHTQGFFRRESSLVRQVVRPARPAQHGSSPRRSGPARQSREGAARSSGALPRSPPRAGDVAARARRAGVRPRGGEDAPPRAGEPAATQLELPW